MTPVRSLLIAALAAASLSACAPMAPGHRMQAGGVDASDRGMPARDRMQEHMKAMHAHHERMQGASTPQERSALMAEHMKLMHDAMATMAGMDCMQGGPGMGGGRGMMMQERPAAPPAKP